MEFETFGAFLKVKRLEHEITLRGFAGLMKLSPMYISDLERNRKAAPSDERLEQIATLLSLSKDEISTMRDLAAMSRSRPTVSNDLPEYIMENSIVRVALRTAKEAEATDKEWQEFIEKLQKRIVRNEKDGEN